MSSASARVANRRDVEVVARDVEGHVFLNDLGRPGLGSGSGLGLGLGFGTVVHLMWRAMSFTMTFTCFLDAGCAHGGNGQLRRRLKLGLRVTSTSSSTRLAPTEMMIGFEPPNSLSAVRPGHLNPEKHASGIELPVGAQKPAATAWHSSRETRPV